jgi:hypothetical protein
MKNFPVLMYHAWVFRSLNFDVELNYTENGEELIEYFYLYVFNYRLIKKKSKIFFRHFLLF